MRAKANASAIADLRRARGLSLSELARRANVSTEAIRRIEDGSSQRPYPLTIRAVADALEVDVQLITVVDVDDPVIRRRVVGELAGQGFSATQIATHLGTGRDRIKRDLKAVALEA